MKLLVLLAALVSVTTLPTYAAPTPRFEVFEHSIGEMEAAQADGKVTSRQLVEQYLARIAAYDRAGPALNSVIQINPNALADADRLDQERQAKGPRGPLHGVPILIKDNYSTREMPTSGGTLALAYLQTAEDATVVRRLREAGAVILGKTTLQELAVGVTTVSSLSGETKNPYDLARSPGGSSGGSAAAVAANFAAAATGSDTCASIRIPPAFQNLYGLRSTRGLVSRAGMVPLSSSQDIAGPIARSVGDIAVMMDAMAGTDPADATTAKADAHKPKSYQDALRPGGLRGARIGVVRNLFTNAPEDADGNALSTRAFEVMRAQGAEVVEVNVPGLNDAMADTSAIIFEFKYELAEFLKRQSNAPVTSLDEIIELGLDHEIVDARFRQRNAPAARDEAAYRRTLEKRAALHDLIVRLMAERKLDALAYPVSLQKPPRIGEGVNGGGGNCQLSASTGLPAMAIPLGFSEGLPIGMELMGVDFAEPTLLKLAYDWEQAAKPRRPPFSTPPLVAGHAPALARLTAKAETGGARLTIEGVYSPTTAELVLKTRLAGVPAEEITGVMLHHGDGGKTGAIFAKLVARDQLAGTVRLTLNARQRAEFATGQLVVRVYAKDAPLGLMQVALTSAAAAEPHPLEAP